MPFVGHTCGVQWFPREREIMGVEPWSKTCSGQFYAATWRIQTSSDSTLYFGVLVQSFCRLIGACVFVGCFQTRTRRVVATGRPGLGGVRAQRDATDVPDDALASVSSATASATRPTPKAVRPKAVPVCYRKLYSIYKG